MSIEEEGKVFAEELVKTVVEMGLNSELNDPGESFMSGTYFGAVQGYKRGINEASKAIVDLLPDIYNKIVDSNFNLALDWKAEYMKLFLQKRFNIDTSNQ